MTFDLDTCGEEGTQHTYGQSGLISSPFDRSDSLVDWFVGNPPLVLIPQMILTIAWRIAANWSQYPTHRCHPR